MLRCCSSLFTLATNVNITNNNNNSNITNNNNITNTLFEERRAKILADLRENKNDKSLAGRVDPQVASLVKFINDKFKCYVTSSSCSGRISLFHKGQISSQLSQKQLKTNKIITEVSAAVERKRGAFGQGAIFQSHDPIKDINLTINQILIPKLEAFALWRKQQEELLQLHHNDSILKKTEVLQFKFEPMIIHILCATIEDAGKLLQCASESAQTESGILACSRGTLEQRRIICCITSPLKVDIPLFTQGKWLLGSENFIESNEWKSLLMNSVIHMNTLFEENEARRIRFMNELKNRLL